MNRSNTSNVLWAYKSLLEAVMKKRIIPSYQNYYTISSNMVATSRKGQKHIYRCDEVKFVLSANIGWVLSKPSAGPEGEWKRPKNKGRKEIVTECLPSNLIYTGFNIYYPEKWVQSPFYSQRYQVSEKLPNATIITHLTSSRPRSQAQFHLVWMSVDFPKQIWHLFEVKTGPYLEELIV